MTYTSYLINGQATMLTSAWKGKGQKYGLKG